MNVEHFGVCFHYFQYIKPLLIDSVFISLGSVMFIIIKAVVIAVAENNLEFMRVIGFRYSSVSDVFAEEVRMCELVYK